VKIFAKLDLMSEVFEIIDSLTFSTRSISPIMWSFFPMLHSAFKEYAIDYIEGNPYKDGTNERFIANIG
jgi:hypothetical protein